MLKLDFQGDTTAQTLREPDATPRRSSTSRFADANDLDVGDTIHDAGPDRASGRASRIVGEVKDNADLLGSMVVTQAAMARDFAVSQDTFDFVKLAPGRRRRRRSRTGSTTLLAEQFPTAEVLNQQELKQNQENQINPLLGLVYALLSLAIIVSLFGIANTLALSIHERTRELGMLRAVGMSRRQVRTHDPLRVGDHRADRRGARHGARPDLRRPDVAAARRTRASCSATRSASSSSS